MGYRDLPVYCHHGRCIDDGDFGDPDDRLHECPDCEADRAIRWAAAVERMYAEGEKGHDYFYWGHDWSPEAALMRVLGLDDG